MSPSAKEFLDRTESGDLGMTLAFKQSFRDLLNQGSLTIDLEENEELLPVGPPLYGKWHAARVEIEAQNQTWFEELNMDLIMRAAAGLGAEVIRKNQEAFVAEAWDQLPGIQEFNKDLRHQQMSYLVAKCLHKKYLESLSNENLFFADSQTAS